MTTTATLIDTISGEAEAITLYSEAEVAALFPHLFNTPEITLAGIDGNVVAYFTPFGLVEVEAGKTLMVSAAGAREAEAETTAIYGTAYRVFADGSLAAFA